MGQEVYGAGIAFTVVPRQYIKVNEDFLVFIDYPITKHNKRKRSMTITLDGDDELSCNLKIIQMSERNMKVKVFHNGEILKKIKKFANIDAYEILGKSVIKLQ